MISRILRGRIQTKEWCIHPHLLSGVGLNNRHKHQRQGVIVGRYHDAKAPYIHGSTLTNGVYSTLDNPKGSAPAGQGTTLNDINCSGVIVGSYAPTSGFIYINGTFKYVSVPRYGFSPVDGINGYGYVVGTHGSNINAYTAQRQ
jgi:hypothetical protein